MKLLSYLGWGIVHERQGTPCQDVIVHRTYDNGNVVVVLSDGAGGARYAREAAQANADAVLDYFRQHSAGRFRALEPERAAEEIVDACLARLRQQAGELGGCRRGDLSATLQFALWDGAMLTLGHLGDGMLLVLDQDGSMSLFSLPEQQMHNSRGTWFTVSPGAAVHLRLYHLEAERAAGFLMTSDGAYGMLRDRGGALVELARKGALNTCAELADVLHRMEPQVQERLDDWSVWIGCPHGEAADAAHGGLISMLQQERERMREITEVNGCDHPN